MNKFIFFLCLCLSSFIDIQAACPQVNFSNPIISLKNAEKKTASNAIFFLQKLTHKNAPLFPKVNLTYGDKLVIFGTGMAGAILSAFFFINGAPYLAAFLLLLGFSAALYIFWMKTGQGPKWLPRLPY